MKLVSNITIVFTLLIVILVGCTTVGMTARQAAITTSHVIALEDSFDKVSPIVEEHIESVKPDDRAKVRNAWNTLLTIRNEIKDDDPSQVLTNVARSQDLYQKTREAYITLRPITERLIANGTISSEDAITLQRIDERAQALDDKMQTLNSNEATVAAIRFARNVVPLVSKIVLGLV